MCRVLMYKGDAVSLDDLLYQPNNSLVKQAYDPQMFDMLSLAGFGMLAWDDTSHHPEVPFSYRSVNIPVFDQNLKELAEKLRVTTLIAHVRGVVPSEPYGRGAEPPPVSLQGLPAGSGPQRHSGSLRPHAFCLARAHPAGDRPADQGKLPTPSGSTRCCSRSSRTLAPRSGPEEIVGALQRTLSIMREVRRRHDIQISSPTNLFISDGSCLVATRFTFDYGCYDMQSPADIRNSRHLFLGIWYTTGKSYGLHDDEWKMIGAPNGRGRVGDHFVRALDARYVDLVRGSRVQRHHHRAGRAW